MTQQRTRCESQRSTGSNLADNDIMIFLVADVLLAFNSTPAQEAPQVLNMIRWSGAEIKLTRIPPLLAVDFLM